MDISGSLEDLQDQNVIVYLLRVFRDKYYTKACDLSTSACVSRSTCRKMPTTPRYSLRSGSASSADAPDTYHDQTCCTCVAGFHTGCTLAAHASSRCCTLPGQEQKGHADVLYRLRADVPGGRPLLPHVPFQ